MCAGFSLCNLVGHPSLNASVDRCRGKSGSGEGGAGRVTKLLTILRKSFLLCVTLVGFQFKKKTKYGWHFCLTEQRKKI